MGVTSSVGNVNAMKKCPQILYGDFDGIDVGFNIEKIQKEMLEMVLKNIQTSSPHIEGFTTRFSHLLARLLSMTREEDTAETIDFEILTEIQHYGGKTNLIDFTTDYLVALFFACDGHHDKELGRITFAKNRTINKLEMIKYPRNLVHGYRVVQKRVFVRTILNLFEPHED